ncbi:GH36 C-terminal domain-containing protein [Neobacillus niacini]|uniref:GH36 C-terminal domain-containing protein n=1 Tax=Neobacillus niacini TaxID=86668 RepID=UPI0005ED6AF3|nr:GH36 C-terminal domain-containing protein [Neobacillus niacini]
MATPNSQKQQTLRLSGLSEDKAYVLDGRTYYGDELMQVGLQLPTEFNGVNLKSSKRRGDFQSNIFYLKCTNENVN